MSDEDIKKLEARLTRLESLLAQVGGTGGAGGTTPGGAVVDPAPWGGGWGGWGGWGPIRWPHPVVDPGPWTRWPHPVIDPAPWPSPVVDPAPGGGYQHPAASLFGRIGQIGDPPPIDISRLSVSQLESSLHTINAERARLSSMETLIKQQLEKLQRPG